MSVNPWRETGENTGWYRGEFCDLVTACNHLLVKENR